MTSKNLIRGLLTMVSCVIIFYANAQVIQGRLTFATGERAKGYKVIVVPHSEENDRTTARRDFTGSDVSQLRKMKAKTEFTNSEGMYYFKKLPAGRYILKVCSKNGTQYKFRINQDNYEMMRIKDLRPMN
jgi:hypothetical protein